MNINCLMPIHGASIYYQGIKYDYDRICHQVEAISQSVNCICEDRKRIIGLLIPRSVWQIYAILGVLKSGNVYIPINTVLPKNRIQYILHHSGAEIVLIWKDLFSDMSFSKEYEIIGNINDDIYVVQKKQRIVSDNKEEELDELAYIIYTSGTTGLPKGVAICMESLCNLKKAYQGKIGCTRYESIVSLADYSFDMFIPEGILALSYGMSVILADSGDIINPRKIVKMLSLYCPQYMQITPSALRLIHFVDHNFSCLKSLKAILVGAEAFPEELFGALKENFEGQICNLYGPTEATVWCSCANLTKENEVHIGKELDGCNIKILDHNSVELSEEKPGEICISGIQVAAGYWRARKEDEDRFVNKAGEVIYKTGDIGYKDSDGNIHYIGRKDDQIKLHGYRIETLEIETIMKKYPFVVDGVAAVDRENCMQQLVVFLIIRKGFEQNKFIDFLKQYLPPYAVPSRVVYVPKLEYSFNGKADRNKMLKIYGRKKKYE